MQFLPEMIDGDADRQGRAIFVFQFQQFLFAFHHGPHGIGEYQKPETTVKAFPHDRDDIRVHERLAACNANFLGRQFFAGDFIQICHNFGMGQVHKCIIFRRGLNVAIHASQVT